MWPHQLQLGYWGTGAAGLLLLVVVVVRGSGAGSNEAYTCQRDDDDGNAYDITV